MAAAFKDWRAHLGPGERGIIAIIAADRKQSRVILRYITGLLQGTLMLGRAIETERNEGIDLTNRITIEVHTSSFRTVRGYTIVAALCDEIAFWPTDDAADPDFEIINALKPGMITIPGALLLCASSPYARRGALWDAYRKHHGKDGPVLVWQSDTRTMNPTVPKAEIDKAVEADPARAQAEYFATFRTDVEAFVAREAVEACVVLDVRERPPIAGVQYFGFTDPSGGGSDSFTLAVAHKDGECAVLDVIREVRPPFSPESVVAEFAALLRSYRIGQISADRYAAEWPREQFRKRGIEVKAASENKSDLYLNLLPILNSRRVDLLDHPKLVNQFHEQFGEDALAGRAGGAAVFPGAWHVRFSD